MRLRRVKAAIGSVLAAVTLLSMSLTGVTAAQASDDNLALNQTVTASSYEVATTAPEKAVDGDLGTRWGTAQNKAANEWIDHAEFLDAAKVSMNDRSSQQHSSSFPNPLSRQHASTEPRERRCSSASSFP